VSGTEGMKWKGNPHFAEAAGGGSGDLLLQGAAVVATSLEWIIRNRFLTYLCHVLLSPATCMTQ